MTAFWGMDTDQVRAHADRLRTASGEVEHLTSRLSTAVHSAAWTGADAEQFRDRWTSLAAQRLEGLCTDLRALSDEALADADEQDAASSADGAPGAGGGSGNGDGYLHEDNPWLPNWLEEPLEGVASDLAGLISDSIGWGVDTGIDVLEGGLGLFGVNTDGIAQFQRDAGHFGGILEDWVTGERVPTIAEVGAAGLLTAGSAGVGIYEAVTGEDTPLLDDRPGGIVESVRTDDAPARSPQTLQDLILDNDALRMENLGGPLEHGQIGVQEVQRAGGGDPAYIVQVPPTEGADIYDVPGAYGGQGNSRDWGSNLRLVAGQDPAAIDDVRAAMEAAGIPPGADVMIVGHSQGGIVANQLAADPGVNSRSGEPGSYNITHTFSVGSPVQTVVPAQGTTESINVNHEASIGRGGFGGDLIATTDLQGLQIDGGTLSAPNRHEVTLDPYPGTGWNPVPVLEANHDSVGPGKDPSGGYAGSVQRATASDPTLSALQDDLTGVYLGEGTYVSRSQVVTVGRGPA
ncbi:WXG100 family type VII secretion target [Brachybacterium saurashtrense]|uniref:WXG100 family type VII secretion target n=1 Tax=Brachybacterium saurashtrense TaxID=556288 RepID=A0A345YKU0_9MICO|nr:WXG100 family type VII secretion target [Brachybacterium saurashtrense]AXK44542.1 WXG100 family type VII secretion target [Brachybacterium saurashtrense]RRR23154.1 WXG100 family type VII secretion target [Brachybacterium saurashtrense]